MSNLAERATKLGLRDANLYQIFDRVEKLEELLAEAYADSDDVLRPRVAQLEARVGELEKALATWQAMGKVLHDQGLRTVVIPQTTWVSDKFDEDRMDIIGPNGNDGLHYDQEK